MVPVLLLLTAVSCVSPKPHASSSSVAGDGDAFAAPTDLTATLATPVDIDLHWQNHASSPACYFVEFAFERHPQDSDFTMLDAFWPDMTRYRHDQVAPETHFVYRVRPLFGRTSAVIGAAPHIATRPLSGFPRVKGDPSPTPSAVVEGPLDLSVEKTLEPKYSVRAARTAAEAAPAGLVATPSFPTAIDLQWQDRASDEDGYLVDISVNPTNDFRLCAVLPPDTTSFRKTGLPAGLKYYFRVRAFFYGKPSNLAEMVSGREPSDVAASARLAPGQSRPLITVERQ